jgi:hypothetical protein
VKAAARRAKLTDYDTQFIEPELTWTQELVLNAKTTATRALVKVWGPDPGTQALLKVADKIDPLKAQIEQLSRFGVRNRIYAYCFCGP